MYITHVEYLGPFIKVCGTLKTNYLFVMREIIDDLIQFRKCETPSNIAELAIGSVVLVKDGSQFYRGRVMGFDNSSIAAYLVDVGKSVDVNLSQIRSVDSEKVKVKPFFFISDIISGHLLYGVVHKKDEEALDIIRGELCSKSFITSLAEEFNEEYLIQITYDDDNDYAHRLLKKKLIQLIDPPLQKKVLSSLSNQQVEALSKNPVRMSYLKNPLIKNIQPPRALRSTTTADAGSTNNLNVHNNTPEFISPKKSVQSRLQPKENRVFISAPDTFTINSRHDVTISHVKANSFDFWVQMRKDEEKLGKMMSLINTYQLQKLKFAPQMGAACIARYSVDKRLYRAAVKSYDLKAIEIVFIDYGNEEIASINDVFEIPECFLEPYTFSRRFTLAGVAELKRINADLYDYFLKLVVGTNMQLIVCKNENAIIRTCELYDPDRDQNVLDVLKTFEKTNQLINTIEPSKLNIEQTEFVKVGYIDSVQKFYVQLQKTQEQYDILYDKMSNYYHTLGEKMTNITVGNMCAANYEKSEWYRGEVIGIEKNNIKILFVDYGFVANMKADRLKKLTVEFVRLPAQAIECCLLGFENCTELNDTSLAQLEMLTGTGTNVTVKLKLHVIKMLPQDRLLVNLFDEAEQPFLNISKRIVQLSLPRAIEKSSYNYTNKSGPNILNSTSVNDDVSTNGKSNYAAKKYSTPSSNKANKFHNNTLMSDDSIQNDKTEMWDESTKSKINSYDNYSRNNHESISRGHQYFQHNKTENWDESIRSGHSMSRGRGGGRRESSPPIVASSSFENDTISNESGRFTTSSNGATNNSHNESTKKEYADFTEEFILPTIEMHKKIPVRLCFWLSPFDFHVQLLSSNNEYSIMSSEIQGFYHKYVIPLDEELTVGAVVVALNRKDNKFHRCKVLDCNPALNKYRVWAIDEGRAYIVEIVDIYKVEKTFMSLPLQGIKCALHNGICTEHIAIILSKIRSYVDNTKSIECEFLTSSDDRHIVELTVNGQSLKELLIRDGLIAEIPQEIDLRQLIGQSVKAQLSKIKDLSSFFIKFDGCELSILSAYKDFKYVKENVEMSIDFKNDYNNEYCVATVESVSADNILMLDLNIPLVPGYKEIAFYRFPVLSKSLAVTVSYIESYNILYVNMKKYENLIQDLLNNMYDFYVEKGVKVDPNNCSLNDIYVSQSLDDDNYYRCRIIEKQDDGHVKVYYIDYGNCETIPNKNLYEMSPNFSECSSGLAIKVYLPIKCLNNDSLMNEIRKSTKEFDLDMSIIDCYKDNWIVDLSYANNSLLQILQLKKFAYIMKSSDLNIESINYSKRSFKLKNDDNPVNTPILNVNNETESIDKYDNSDCDYCYIAHFDSPNGFYIQLHSDKETIHNLQEEIQDYAKKAADLSKFNPETRCLAKFRDGLFYRAVIKERNGYDITYHFLDYGNTETGIIGSGSLCLKKFSTPSNDLKPFATHCSFPLSATSKNWSNESKKIMDKYMNVKIEYKIVGTDKSKTFVEIYDSETKEKVSESLVKLNLGEKLKMIKSDDMCYVSNLYSLNDFTIQLESDSQALDLMASYLQDNAITFEKLNDPKVGDYCVTLYDDDEYYRAKVQAIKDDQIQILYVDYGNSAWSTRSLLKIPDELTSVQLSKQCAFRVDKDVAHHKGYLEAFKYLMDGGIFKIVLIELGETAVIDLLCDGVPVLTKIKEMYESTKKNNPPTEPNNNQLSEAEAEEESSESVIIVTNTNSDLLREKTMMVYVSSFTSINNFYIQIDSDKDEIHVMENLLLKRMDPVALNDVQVGKVYAALYDDTYCRAKVLSVNKNKSVNVLFLDYGHSKAVTEFREIPETLLAVKHLARHCSLNTYVELNEEAIQHFRDVIQDGGTKLKCEIIDNSVDPIIVNLYLEEKDLLEELLNINQFCDTDSASKSSTIRLDAYESNDSDKENVQRKMSRDQSPSVGSDHLDAVLWKSMDEVMRKLPPNDGLRKSLSGIKRADDP